MVTQLGIKTCYSLLESTIRIDSLVKKAKDIGYDAIGIADHHVLYAYPLFNKICKEQGIKPIFGLEVTCLYHEQMIPFLFYAKDNVGYKNLIALSSLLNNDREYCTLEEMIRYSEHNFLIAFGEGGYLDSELTRENDGELITKLKLMKEELPPFDMAITFQESSFWAIKNALLKRLCNSLNIPTVAINRTYYLEKNDAKVHQIVSAIKLQTTLQDKSLQKKEGRYLLSIEEMKSLYDRSDLDRTSFIAKECNANLELPKTDLPKYHVSNNLRQDQYLTQLALVGLKKRLNDAVPKEYIDRLKYELSIITKMHFENYFLIVYDFIRYAKQVGIRVGPGRGSACGSLCAYCLGITEIDPIKYHLLFERFLNPERISMPDIDTDFPDDRRGEVISYVQKKYGADHVASIVTFGTFAAKQSLRDTGKVLNIGTRDLEMVLRLIPSGKITLNEAYRQSSRLREIINANKNFRELFEYARMIEGLPRHTSNHPAGIVMSLYPLNDIVPTINLDQDLYISQYSMEYLEDLGLIKMDFLGLKNLSIIDAIVQDVKKKEPEFNLNHIPLDDKEVYNLFSNADTLGIFQFESDGMKNLLKRMKPKSFDDLIATLALFRPASANQIPTYIENRKHPESVSYIDPSLKPILESTYGVMIYQEQAMQISEVAAGFTLGKADILRKAISKKKTKDLLSLKDDFMHGCIKNGYAKENAETLFSLIEQFGGYGFNKSHAVAYSVIAYQMAYLKVHYPISFYSSLIDNVIGDDAKISQYVFEAKIRGIECMYPNVNISTNHCYESNGALSLPLTLIKKVSKKVVENIMQERNSGKYTDFYDFVMRMNLYKVDRPVYESLIKAGALDEFGYTRSSLLGALVDALNYADMRYTEINGIPTLTAGTTVSKQAIINVYESEENKIEYERESLGFLLCPHPIIALKNKLDIHTDRLMELQTKKGKVNGFAMIQSIREHRTKKGDLMAFVSLTDESGDMSLLVMPDLYSKKGTNLKKNEYIGFTGTMTEDASCIAKTLYFYRNRSE